MPESTPAAGSRDEFEALMRHGDTGVKSPADVAPVEEVTHDGDAE